MLGKSGKHRKASLFSYNRLGVYSGFRSIQKWFSGVQTLKSRFIVDFKHQNPYLGTEVQYVSSTGSLEASLYILPLPHC